MNREDYKIAYENVMVANKMLEKEIERLNKSLEEQRHFYLEKIQQKENIIKEVREYIENVEILATIDKVNIFSISTLKSILDKGKE